MSHTDRRSFLQMMGMGAMMTTLKANIAKAQEIPANNTTRSIQDVEHVVILMQENRPFDHHFGTLRGVRGFSDPRAVEEDYYARTGVFPVMHVVALRADVHERHPWIAMNLLGALEEAKRRSIERALDANAPRFPVPWAPANAERAAALMGADFWPYGIERNRTTLETFLRWALEQGVCASALSPEDLFVPQVRESFRV